MRKYLIALFVLTMATVASGESSRPQPKSPEIDLNKQIEKSIEKPKTAKQTNYSANKQLSTLPQPVATIEKPVTEAKKENRADNRPEFYIPFFGYGLKITDILMIILTGALAWYTRRLNRATEKLWEAGEKQMQITRDSLELARQEFNSTHRPQIIIHTFTRNKEPDKKIGASFTYVNIGTTPAKVIEIAACISFSNERTSENTITEQFDNVLLKPGEEGTFTIKSNISDMVAIIDSMRASRGQSSREIVCIGRIKYIDMQGTTRQTGFCRVFDTDQYCWQQNDNSDYEYAY